MLDTHLETERSLDDALGTGSASRLDALALEAHRRYLVKFAAQRLRNAEQAEDVVQETLLVALQGAERFRGDAAVRTWLTGILKNKILEHFRRERRHVPLEGHDDELELDRLDARHAEDGDAPGPGLPADWGDPEAALLQGQFFDQLAGCMAHLPSNTARAFHMREVLGMSAEEVSAALGVTASNSGVLLHRARASLRDCLQAKGFEGERRDHPRAA